MWRICHKQLLMVKIWSENFVLDFSTAMLVGMYKKLFPKYLHNLHILHTYDF